mmetsp:Transcript_2664/g.4547  ORF Transcript_2664/g.4547 Transcript_2664/m.4547 type:complete len:527 (+) Transcript_2664:74-1654(+)|eukprot:CAMPEP_0119101508 /NCGR_PEP_ID=MMETSP1180-20130426/542_1 /TAXON_ID=3052 ORGANISM="Chlamydomonas cf sp, Strain CCMP681" /NCGR_SAMPLE_ID=MMETSP1180 /ASSEMBLY_ACC=CAM_ASM_000741 /LENGTH=526 /DNA_ID=CAMNT_0007085641 /DNA_START=66 /DNA_END=1646 /DNA_ORIENTATION=+
MSTGCTDAQLAILNTAGFTTGQLASLCSAFSAAAVPGDANVSDVANGLDAAWLLLCGALVFIMHGGFAMLCAGAIRSKNTLNILLMTILDLCVSAIMWYTVGFGFAWGYSNNGSNQFIGNALFGAHDLEQLNTGTGIGRWQDWFWQWAFAATATTIPAGCVAERFNFNAYLAYTMLLSGFVYPVVVHWVWCSEGWLTAFAPGSSGIAGFKRSDQVLFGSGMIDFAGSGVVHMVGGLTGMMGAWLVGPRLGRFDSNGQPVDMPGHSAVLVVLGTVLLWFGWYGFNPGSVGLISHGANQIAARSAVCTTLSAAAGGCACLLNGFRRQKAWDLVATCNGVLCGLVAVTACAHVIEPWAAILNGLCAGLIFDGVCWIFLRLRIDDPLSAAPMHGFAGMWGVFFTGLLAKPEYVTAAYGSDIRDLSHYGAFYPGSSGHLIAAQIIGILVITGWVCTLTGICFFILKRFSILRISEEDEHRGLDASKHGGSAYNHTDMLNGRGNVSPALQIKPRMSPPESSQSSEALTSVVK